MTNKKKKNNKVLYIELAFGSNGKKFVQIEKKKKKMSQWQKKKKRIGPHLVAWHNCTGRPPHVENEEEEIARKSC